MEIDTEFTDPEEAVLHVRGEVDMNTSDELRQVLIEAADKTMDRVTVDLGDVEFMDSSGIATLVEGQQRLREHGGELVLVNLTDPVRSVLEIANLMEVFTIESSV